MRSIIAYIYIPNKFARKFAFVYWETQTIFQNRMRFFRQRIHFYNVNKNKVNSILFG